MKRALLITALLFLQLSGSSLKAEETTVTPMIVKNIEGRIQIGLFSNNKNMEISFFPGGVNHLFGIGKVSYYASRTDYLQGKTLVEFSSCTDWVGPYFVCSASSVNAGISQKFTGGWHGSNGDGTGLPTASTSKARFIIDRKEISGNFEQNCNQVDLFITNLIHGYDYPETNTSLLKENVHYSIKPDGKIDVEVKIEALEDAVIQRYYGLQCQHFSVFDRVHYLAGQQTVNTEGVNMDSRCLTNNGINTILLKSADNRHQLRLTLDITRGLGTFENLENGKPKAFSASYGKSYFNLINGKNLIIKKGHEVFWKGSYFWD